MSWAEDAYKEAQKRIAAAKAERSPELHLSGLDIEEIPPEIEDLDWLKRLQLDLTNIEDIGVLSHLTNLEVLNLDRTKVSNVAPLSGLVKLQTLFLDCPPLADVSPLAGLINLEQFSLEGTKVTDVSVIAGFSKLEFLYLQRTLVRDLTPLKDLEHLRYLNLSSTQVLDLRPIKGLRSLIEGAKTFEGLFIGDTPATENDPDLYRLSEIEDNEERTREILNYLNTLPDDPPAKPDPITKAVAGPVLTDAPADIDEIEQMFASVPMHLPAGDMSEPAFKDTAQALAYAALRLSGSASDNRLGKELVTTFKDYRSQLLIDPPNGRLLNMLGASVRGAFGDPDIEPALDGFDRSLITSFLSQHQQFIDHYFPDARRPLSASPDLSEEELLRELPRQLAATRGYVDGQVEAGIFAENVLVPVDMLEARADAAKKVVLTTNDPERRSRAVASLNQIAVVLTGYVGVIQGRLIQYARGSGKFVREHPVTAIGGAGSATIAVNGAIELITPLFQSLWRWIGNLPLPF